MTEKNDEILNIGQISKSLLDLQSMLNQVANEAMIRTGADASAILLLDEYRQTLTLKASVGLSAEAVDAVRLPKGSGVSWKIARERRPVALAVANLDPYYHFVPISGESDFTSLMGVPLIDEDDCIGVLYVQNVEETHYSHDDIEKLVAISTEVSGAIKVAWDFHRAEQRARTLLEFNETARKINATNNINEIINLVCVCARDLIGAQSQLVWLANREGQLSSIHHSLNEELSAPPSIHNGIAKQVMESKEAVYIPSILDDNRFEGLDDMASVSVLCNPMIFEDQAAGVVMLGDRRTESPNYFSAFSGEEIEIFNTLTQTAAQAIIRARTHHRLNYALEENEKNVKELSILFQLSMAMRRTIKLDDLFRVILSCVTVGSGLGFNRAILFLIDNTSGMLEGVIGMGPDSADEAGRIWGNMQEKPLDDLVPWLLDRDPYELNESGFNKLALSMHFPIDGARASSIIKKVVGQKIAVNIEGQNDLHGSDHELVFQLQCDRFAMVPLVAKDDVLGAILVDNLYNGDPISTPDMELLTRFAAPAAWAIENLRLFERWAAVSQELLDMEDQVAKVERLSALGEVTAEVAHELKNPLVSIGGYARRLQTSLSKRNVKKEVNYASIIVREVERLEGLLRQALDVSKEVTLTRETADLNGIVNDSTNLYWRYMSERGIEVEMNLDPQPVMVSVDPTWMRQVVINLLLNAIEAMNCERHKVDRKISIVTKQSAKIAESRVGVRRSACLQLSDTGGGIAEEDLPSVFNPFFTTKPQGSGLGLSLCKKIVRLHHGSIEIDNKLGDGVTFTVTLPSKAVGAD